MRVALSTWAETMYGYSLVSCDCSLVPHGCSLGPIQLQLEPRGLAHLLLLEPPAREYRGARHVSRDLLRRRLQGYASQ